MRGARRDPRAPVIFQAGRSLEVTIRRDPPPELLINLAATPAKSADLGVFFVPTSTVAFSAGGFQLADPSTLNKFVSLARRARDVASGAPLASWPTRPIFRWNLANALAVA
jgi:hypothetical protein